MDQAIAFVFSSSVIMSTFVAENIAVRVAFPISSKEKAVKIHSLLIEISGNIAQRLKHVRHHFSNLKVVI